MQLKSDWSKHKKAIITVTSSIYCFWLSSKIIFFTQATCLKWRLTGAIQDIGAKGAEKYLTFYIVQKIDKIFKEASSPVCHQMDNDPWSNQTREGGSTIGIALISNQNTILAMRSSLNLRFRHLGVEDSNNGQVSVVAKGIVDLFGSLSATSISKETNLKSILLPYLKSGCSTWIDKPLADQARTFE